MMKRLRRAEMNYVTSALYCGEMKEGKRDGKGHEFSESGDLVYSGYWKDGKYSGLGVYYHSDGIPQFNGEFLHGEPIHITEFDKRSRPIFEGIMKNNQRFSGCIWSYEQDDREWTSETESAIFVDNLPSIKGFKYWRENRYSALYSYQGELNRGQEHGYGELYLDGNSIYRGEFLHGKYHGTGYHIARMRYVSDPLEFHGEFIDGNSRYGTITSDVNNDVKNHIYEGEVKYDGEYMTCHGKGKTFKDGFVLEGQWNDGELNAAEELKLTWNSYEACGRMTEFIPGFSFEFEDAKLIHHGVLIFNGKFHVHPADKKVCRIEGTIYVHGIPRAICNLIDDEVDRISVLFDEDGHMCSSGNDGQMIGLKDGWPVTIDGELEVYSSNESLMYTARFQEGAIRNLMEVANTIPTTTLHLPEAPIDIITMENIASGTIAYALNSSHHLVTKETLQALKSSKNLSRHPYTRAPIMRIYRVSIQL